MGKVDNVITEHGFTRREVFGIFGVTAAFAIVSAAASHFAMADGAGEGDVSGWVPGGDEPSYYGFMWVYRDNGGFVDTEDGIKRNSEFGWNEDSVQGFWEGPMRDRWNEVGNHLFGGDRNFGWFGYEDAKGSYESAAREAIEAAKIRAGTDKARIVAVGWPVGYYSTDDGGIGTMYIDKWSSDRTRDNILPRNGQNTYTDASDTGGDGAVKFRVGNSLSDLGSGIGSNNAGWSDQAILPNGTTYDTWYDYLWHIYQSGSSASENGYVYIVLAVADTEPESFFPLKISKKLAGAGSKHDGNREFSFTVTFSGTGAPASQTFTLKGGESVTIEQIPVGVKWSVTEITPSDYTVTWSGQTGTISNSNNECEATNTAVPGKLSVKKVVVGGEANASFTFRARVWDGDDVYLNQTFTLTNGQTQTFDNLPKGANYEVTEIGGAEHYETQWTNRTGTIVAGVTAEVTCKNISHGYATIEKRLTI